MSQAVVSTVLVGSMVNGERVGLVRRMVKSDVTSDFIDDVGKLIRNQLFEN